MIIQVILLAIAKSPTKPIQARRNFLMASAAMSVGALTACSHGTVLDIVKTTALTKERRDALSPDDLIRLAKEGNERFRKGEQRPRDFLAEQQSSAKGQYPAAMLLTCIDSRAPAEILLDLGIGDVFNSRIAGNIVNEDILGSMEFACELSGAKLVVVMGHTSCGAIKGAINHTKLGNLTALLAKIIPAVDATVYEENVLQTTTTSSMRWRALILNLPSGIFAFRVQYFQEWNKLAK